MNYKSFDFGNYRLNVIQTNKFKTIDVKCYFYREITKEEVTFRNFLIDILLYASKKYPTKKQLMLHCQDLYSTYITSVNMRFGNYYMTKLGISFLNPKYTDSNMLDENLDLLSEILFNPLVNEGKFDQDIFNIIKTSLKAETETIKEQPRSYANIRLLASMNDNKPYAINGYCNLDILKTITEENLYTYYKDFLANTKVDIFVIGDVSFEEIKEKFAKYFNFTKRDLTLKPLIIEHTDIREEAFLVVESEHYQQSKLAIACKLKDLTDFEYKYVTNLYNMLFGGNSDCLLMKVIREENSLAYYANSSLSKADNLLLINAGIDAKNFEKTKELIKKILIDIQKGCFDTESLEKSKIEYISTLDEATESPGGIIDIYLGQLLFNADDLELRKAKIKEVTKEDIMRLAKKINIDTIYLLKGEL